MESSQESTMKQGTRKLDHRTSDKPLPLPWQNDRQHTLQTSPWNFRSEGGRDHL